MIMDKPNIYNYSSFNSYLNDWVDLNRQKRGLTLGALTKELSLNSIAEISNVLKGRRPVSDRILSRLVKLIGFKSEEVFYVNLIVEIDRNVNKPFIRNILIDKCSHFNG